MSAPIDNLHLIQPLLTFRDEDDFYMLEVTQRRKDNPQLSSAEGRILRRYNVFSLEYLEKRWDEIRGMCEAFNARAMIRLNVRSYRATAFHTLENMARAMCHDHYRLAGSWDKSAGQHHAAPDKTWVLDLDSGPDSTWGNPRALACVKDAINEAAPYDKLCKIVAEIPSKTGLHLITRPFDSRAFTSIYSDISVHKDNPTNLYIP
jgi:hypothetical protein